MFLTIRTSEPLGPAAAGAASARTHPRTTPPVSRVAETGFMIAPLPGRPRHATAAESVADLIEDLELLEAIAAQGRESLGGLLGELRARYDGWRSDLRSLVRDARR